MIAIKYDSFFPQKLEKLLIYEYNTKTIIYLSNYGILCSYN